MLNRKKSTKNRKDVDFTSPIKQEEKKDFVEFLRFQALYDKLKEKKSAVELINELESDVLIPVSIFSKELGALESICKYLKENLGFKNKKIASLIDRDSKSVWQAYNSSKNKLPIKFENLESNYLIPASILKNKKLGVLENIVAYLKDSYQLSYHEIALLLKRDERTIWTTYKNSMEKDAKQ
ncbi:MAG: hypothetical protein Q8R00_03935 [Candidatus Nanoarchaeia archaeon]|nr:hypothetical protein [Candidatus Nanoarchaeia archaeon]